MPSIGTMLVIWGLLAPIGVYGWQKADHTIRQRHAVAVAVKNAKAESRRECNEKIDSIAKEINDDAAKRIREAREAVAGLPPTPTDDAGLLSLCKRSASCRDR